MTTKPTQTRSTRRARWRRPCAWALAAFVCSSFSPIGCTSASSPGLASPDAADAYVEPTSAAEAEMWASYDAELDSRAQWAQELDVYEFDAPPKPKDPKPSDDKAPPGGTVAEEPKPDETASATPKHGRQIIYNASLGIGVYDLQQAMVAAEELPERYGGWIHMRTEGQLIMRLPADALRTAMDDLGKLGIVQSRTLQAEDVTAEYVDLESRIKVLKDTQVQLLALLEKAKTVEEALHVRRALDDVTLELEGALGRMRQLTNLISYSTLTVYLYELGPTQPIPSSNDPFPWVDELGVETTEWR